MATMGDCISTKKVICFIQENGIARSDEALILGRFDNDFKYENIKESEYSEYMKVVTKTLCNDDQFYYAWQSNIAMPIQDRLSGVDNIHELSNLCAKDFLDRLIK
jgi:hypothetical protein